MKIELNENKIFFNNGKSVQEIHPFWIRERVDGDEFLDKGTQQRLFDPSTMNGEILIKKVEIIILTILFIFAIYSSLTIGSYWDEPWEMTLGKDRLKYLFSLGAYKYLSFYKYEELT